MTRVYGIIFVGFTRESIGPLVGAFAGNVNAVGDTNITQLFDIVDRLKPRVIISLMIKNNGCERNVVTWRATIPRNRRRCAISGVCRHLAGTLASRTFVS